MVPFATIGDRARMRAGGAAVLEGMLPVPADAGVLAATSGDRYLSAMGLRIFSAGLRHDMVAAKWPAFEEAFHGFSPHRVAAMSDEGIDARLCDRRLIRHAGKMRALVANAQAIRTIDAAHGGFGTWLAEWPVRDVVGLWASLAERFRHLGGASGPYFLRSVGKDTFLLTGDVVKALIAAEVIRRAPSSPKDRSAVQEAFNAWMDETGRPLCQLSRILALSVG